MKNNVGSEEGAVARLTGVGGREPPASLHGRIHPAPKFHSPSVMVNSLTNLGAGSCRASNRTLPTPRSIICWGDDSFFMIVRISHV